MFFKCSHRAPADEQPQGRVVSKGSSSKVVDIHCHRECAPAAEMMKVEAERVGFGALSFGSELTKEVNQQQLVDIKPKMQSLDERIADMDRMGIDIQAVSISPYQYYYWSEPGVGRDVSKLINDNLASAIGEKPDRFVGLGTVPLQNTEMAITELDRCVNELGFKGIEINSQISGEELSTPRLAPFWAKVEELDILVFIHTAGFTHADRLKDHYFINLIGHPIEATLAISRLIFDGVLENHPGLKIVVAHGGGFLPAYSGRMDHAYRARKDVREGLPDLPSEYLKRLHFDTMVFESDQLEYLINKFGPNHILLGTDYPYDMGEDDPLGLVNKVKGLNEQDCSSICGGNAARLLKI
ncbi:MAG TPA: amidohydrolase [Rhodospirillales bacterium]|jgi:aminocarboxymuconate-semialdehyde decarboxylase|nr:amidohydrolase [Rhodospirillales bacterium]HIL74637.1 amidohydrolase [Rhodospirillales bacterium]